MKAEIVAKYILSLSKPEYGDFISNLKLQKLLYYVQGYYLAITGKPLFDENVLNWQYGPVVKEVYDIYKSNGSKAIEVDNDFDISVFTDEQKEIIDEVYENYGQFSALRLAEMTHEEAPWKNTSRNDVISKELMRDFFKAYIKE